MKRRGFSLVELIIVIAIIGILASLVLPAISQAIKKSKEKAAAQALDARKPVDLDKLEKRVILLEMRLEELEKKVKQLEEQ